MFQILDCIGFKHTWAGLGLEAASGGLKSEWISRAQTGAHVNEMGLVLLQCSAYLSKLSPYVYETLPGLDDPRGVSGTRGVGCFGNHKGRSVFGCVSGLENLCIFRKFIGPGMPTAHIVLERDLHVYCPHGEMISDRVEVLFRYIGISPTILCAMADIGKLDSRCSFTGRPRARM